MTLNFKCMLPTAYKVHAPNDNQFCSGTFMHWEGCFISVHCRGLILTCGTALVLTVNKSVVFYTLAEPDQISQHACGSCFSKHKTVIDLFSLTRLLNVSISTQKCTHTVKLMGSKRVWRFSRSIQDPQQAFWLYIGANFGAYTNSWLAVQ